MRVSSIKTPLGQYGEDSGLKIVERPKNNWKDLSNQKLFLERIAPDLGINKLEDWRNIKVHQVIEKGGGSMLKHYGGSLQRALKTLYTQINWNFDTKPIGY